MIAATSTDGQLNNGETDVDCKLLGLDGRRLVLEQAHARGAAPAVQPRRCSPGMLRLQAYMGSYRLLVLCHCCKAPSAHSNTYERHLPACLQSTGGGPTSPYTCPTGKTCINGPRDCVSSVCAGGKCQAPTCLDSAKNALETDVDW